MEKWEYMYIKGRNYRSENEVIEELNILGKDGWEAFTTSIYNEFSVSVYLKRKIEEVK